MTGTTIRPHSFISPTGKPAWTKLFLDMKFPIWENILEVSSSPQTTLENALIETLRAQTPIRDLPGVRILDVNASPTQPFDVSFQLEAGSSRVRVLGEIRDGVTPKVLEEIAPWVARLKAVQPDFAFLLICPYLTPLSQAFCIEKGIDFIDAAGNISIDVPGRMVLRRLGKKGKQPPPTRRSARIIGVYSGKASRVLRVLLQKPGMWNVTKIAKELAAETRRNRFAGANSFEISLGSISKVFGTLEEELLIRRRNSAVLVPEPRRLLTRWAEKYRERYRWRLRSAFTCPNPFGADPRAIGKALDSIAPGGYALTGTAAASVRAPFVDLDLVEVFLTGPDQEQAVRQLKGARESGPCIRFLRPYDLGVFLYARSDDGVPVVADIQTYLDLYARGGRDFKQAEYLLETRIMPGWSRQ